MSYKETGNSPLAPSRDGANIFPMSDTTYITRSDLDDAFAQFRDETATLVADVVADRLREFRGGNGLPPTPHSDSAPTKTLESDAALILQGIAALSEVAALTQSEVGELKTDVAAVKAELSEVKGDVAALKVEVAEVKIDLVAEMAEVKTELKDEIAEVKTELKDEIAEVKTELKDEIAEVKTELKGEMAELKTELRSEMAELKTELKDEMAELKTELRGEMTELKTELKLELKLEVTDVKTENRSTREALEATAELIRNEIATEHAELRADMVREVSKVSENVRELQGATRTVKWLFSVLAAATLGILTMFHQDLGRRIDGVRAELHASISEVRTDLSGLRDNMVDVFDRLVRIETMQNDRCSRQPARPRRG